MWPSSAATPAGCTLEASKRDHRHLHLCTSACVAKAWPRMLPSGVMTATPVSSQLLSMPSTRPRGEAPACQGICVLRCVADAFPAGKPRLSQVACLVRSGQSVMARSIMKHMQSWCSRTDL